MRREHIIAVLLFVSVVLLRLYYLWIPIDYTIREGSTGMSAWMILDGKIMYRDFYHAQAPLWGHMVAVMYALLGVGLTQGRLLVTIWSGILVLVIFFSGVKGVNIYGGLLGGVIFLLHPVAIQYGTQALNDFPAVTCGLIAYYIIIGIDENFQLTINQNKREKRFLNFKTKYFLAGACLGLGASIKLTVAPYLLAFIIFILIEAYNANNRLKTQLPSIIFLILGFIVVLGMVSAYFLLTVRDEFIFQVLGQHLSDEPLPWLYRFTRPFEQLWAVDKLLIFILLPSIPFALKSRYGRGLMIILVTMVLWIIFIVAFPHSNYYDMNIPILAMICGFFPLFLTELTKIRTKFRVNRLITIQIFGGIMIVSYLIYLVFIAPSQVKPIFEDDPALPAVEWLKVNTDPDEYVLCDNTNVNIMAQRRGPFAEISIDRMNLGLLTSKMVIQSLYEYNIRVVVIAKRQFGKYEAYDELMEFIEANYSKTEAGYEIYFRDLPLSSL